MNTKEQELFWQAIGFKKRRRKVCLAGGMGRYKIARRTVSVSPDGEIYGIYGYDDLIYPIMDANNFFKWVLPAVLKKTGLVWSIICDSGVKDTDAFIRDIYQCAWEALN